MRRSVIVLVVFGCAVAIAPTVGASVSGRSPTAAELKGIRAGVRTWWCHTARRNSRCSSWTFSFGQTLVSTSGRWALTSYRARQNGRIPQQPVTSILRLKAKWTVAASFTELEGQSCAVAARQLGVPEPIAKDLGICKNLPGP